MDPFATSSDVANRWRPLLASEVPVADTLCGDASAVIRARFPGIDSEISTGQVDETVVTAVVANMVKRAMIGGSDGVSQDSETVGPYSHSQTFANPLGNVFLLAAEVILILGYQPSAVSACYANTTSQNMAVFPDGYVIDGIEISS